ncbi:hypothetical protein L1987_54179 [Smallanthus sonchifolius]|uniref:Uncharacterized protein n=1 Tax=Smallanthus sonchifolius TaxID=185202 RepID=A0ACB9E6I3_9ASTR|nr:hypothetical protein L1987_54179 [Smallanthus sonchifolius]
MRFHIIVFSKNYASSSWCLDELVKLMECQKTIEQTAYPIFYDGEPTEIRNQSGAVGEAFAKHVEKEAVEKHEKDSWSSILLAHLCSIVAFCCNGSSTSLNGFAVDLVASLSLHLYYSVNDLCHREKEDDVGRWRNALKEAAGLAGWELKNTFNGVKNVVSSLGIGSEDVHIIRIKGIGGGGKTTLARAVFNHISTWFEDQLEALTGELTWFKPESRIIITTRDEYAFKKEIPNQGYEELLGNVVHYAAGLPLTIKVLSSHLCGRTKNEWVDAIERLKTIPFKKTLERLELSYNGLEDDQKEIFLDVVCILKGERIDRAIRLLKSWGFNAQIGLRVLDRKSLITISDTEYLGMHDHIEEMGWKYLGMHDHIEEMGWNIVCRSHPLEPSRHSRLWIKEEIEDMLVNESVLKKIKFIDLTCSKLRTFDLRMAPLLETLDLGGSEYFVELQMPVECSNLKFLDLSGSKVNLGLTPHLERLYLIGCHNFVELLKPVECPNLERLYLIGCHDFIELLMPVECPSLKSLDFSGSKVSRLNLGLVPYLKRLDLKGCHDFVELHLPVECPDLKLLNLSGSKLSNLNLELTPHLERLDVENCYYLQEVYAPVGCLKNLLFLNLSNSLRFEYFLYAKGYESPGLDSLATLELTAESIDICRLHSNDNLSKFRLKCKYKEPLLSWSGNVEKLISLGLCACTNLESFSATICGLQHLKELRLEGNIPNVLKDLWKLEGLKNLSLRIKEIKNVPKSICMLKHLKSLTHKSCWLLERLPENIFKLECLEELYIEDCRSLRDIPNNICKIKCLKRLRLSSCHQVEKFPEELGRLECLEELHITGCRSLRDIPNSLCKMKCLKRLHLSSCNQVEKLSEELGRLECLEELHLTGFTSLPDIQNNICNMICLKHLHLSGDLLSLFSDLEEPMRDYKRFSFFVYRKS